VTEPRRLTPADADYPRRLLLLTPPPAELTLAGSLSASRAIAIVGTRNPIPPAAAFARELAGALARRGAVVVSGGASGIDAEAHEGALAHGGRTWVVAGTGHGVLYPRHHGDLFRRVVDGGGAMLWPFPAGTIGHPSRFLQRNGVLVALADAVVVVQARIPSGALNAASWARRLGRPRWVVCPAPWDARGGDFAGCHQERRLGADVLTSIDHFLDAIALPEITPASSAPPPTTEPRNPAEAAVIGALGQSPRHIDDVVVKCGLPYPEVMTALLTLALDDVLVEGPDGFFRLPSPP